MGLVDLRGREDEAAVRALLAFAHGSRASVDVAVARYRRGDRALVGWDEGGALVACSGLTRRGNQEVVLGSLAVSPGRRGRGVGRALIEAIADIVNAERLVAETDDDAVGFYRRCGFSVEELEPKEGRARYRCSREIETRPGSPVAVRAVTLGDLEDAISRSWGHDTSDDPDEWSEDNRARGQCVVTALLVRELLGGDIMLANVLRKGVRVERHAWNRLTSGISIDLTRSQFTNGEELEEPVLGEPILVNRARYELLTRRVREQLP